MSGESGATSWVTESWADDYFATRLHASMYWNVSGVNKEAALVTAQHAIQDAGEYEFPEEPTNAMMRAVCEQALYLLRFPEAEEREALRVQGVSGASIVGETYRPGKATQVLAPRAAVLLATYRAANSGTYEIVR